MTDSYFCYLFQSVFFFLIFHVFSLILNWLSFHTDVFIIASHLSHLHLFHYIFYFLYFRTIILFDEIEEFCLDRENPSLGMESRMLTTAMLTQVRTVHSPFLENSLLSHSTFFIRAFFLFYFRCTNMCYTLISTTIS